MNFPSLSRRDRNAVALCLLFLAVFVAVRFVYMPAAGKRDRLEKLSAQKKRELTEMAAMRKQYGGLKQHLYRERAAVSQRDKDFSLFSFLDTRAEQIGVKENVAYMNPSFTDIENEPFQRAFVKLKLEDLYLKQCVDFLDSIDVPEKGVRVNAVSLSRSGKEDNLLDVVVETETLIPGKS